MIDDNITKSYVHRESSEFERMSNYSKEFIRTCRYQRGSRSLLANLGDSSAALTGGQGGTELEEDDDEDYDIPEEIEEIIGE